MQNEIVQRFQEEIKAVSNLKDLESLRAKYLGKQGLIRKELLSIQEKPVEQRKAFGEEVNAVKQTIESLFLETEKNLKSKQNVSSEEFFDYTFPGKVIPQGHLHVLTQTIEELENIFSQLGFEVAEGPEVEDEWHNFDAVNVPANHPARDMQDTFWLKQLVKSPDNHHHLLMRTQTSSMQVRYMEENNPPLRIIVPGRTYRYEAADSTHDVQFTQLEGLMVDKNISVANFKAIVNAFFSAFFKENIEIRLRPSYFPFTEPSFEIDVKRSNKEWLELGGAGIVHPNVLRNCGIDPTEWRGFAFGLGIERLAMIKHGIPDARLFLSGDLRFIKQF